eukprot:9616124-Heterocapsa_arctica.AAC.1
MVLKVTASPWDIFLQPLHELPGNGPVYGAFQPVKVTPSKSRLPPDVFRGSLDGHLLNEFRGGLPEVDILTVNDPDARALFLPAEF